jgi:hypothetical protein
MSAMGQTLPIHSASAPTNVCCYSNSDPQCCSATNDAMCQVQTWSASSVLAMIVGSAIAEGYLHEAKAGS